MVRTSHGRGGRGTHFRHHQIPNFRAATLQKCGLKISSVFLCQRCRVIWREILVKFLRVLRFPGFGFRDGPNTTTTIIFQKSFASDATPKRHLMTHQMKNLCAFSVFHCVEGAFGASSGGTPKMKNGAPRDELKNGRGRGWAGPYGCPKRKISPNFHAKNGVKNGKFHASFTLLGRGANKLSAFARL